MSDATFLASWVLGAALALVLVVTLAIGTFWFALTSGRHRTFGAGVLLIAYLIDAALVMAPSFPAALNISTNDIAAMLLLLALAVSAIQRPLPINRPMFLLWLGFTGLAMMNLAIGLGQYGSTAGVEIRPTFGFLVAALYFCVNDFSPVELRRMARWCLWAGYALVGLAIYRWVGVTAGFLSMSLIQGVGDTNEFRALRSDTAFYLAMLSLVQFVAWLRGCGTSMGGFHTLLFATMVLVLQHRSVWVAYGAGSLFILIQEYRRLPRRLLVLLTGLLLSGALVGLAAAFGLFDRLIDALVESTVSVGDRSSTAMDRVLSWESLMSDWLKSDVWTLLFGYPFGYGFRRNLGGFVVDYQPHNFYVFMILRVGAIGTMLFVLSLIVSWVHAVRVSPRDESDHVFVRSIGVMMLCSIIYYVPYQGIYVHGAITGLALGLMIHRADTLTPEPRVVR